MAAKTWTPESFGAAKTAGEKDKGISKIKIRASNSFLKNINSSFFYYSRLIFCLLIY
jgi:hypothetical protein